jgi:hypothetical protein
MCADDREWLAACTGGYSVAELSSVVREASLTCLASTGSGSVTREVLVEVVAAQPPRNSLSSKWVRRLSDCHHEPFCVMLRDVLKNHVTGRDSVGQYAVGSCWDGRHCGHSGHICEVRNGFYDFTVVYHQCSDSSAWIAHPWALWRWQDSVSSCGMLSARTIPRLPCLTVNLP